MRKGDLKKQAILTAAERFFCARGYEETSIQDIMDETHVSKGGFYHYFASKETLLAELCISHTQGALDETLEALKELTDPMERINAVFSGAMPIQGASKRFLLMFLPVMDKPEGFSVLARWQQELLHAFLPLLTEEIAAAQAQQRIYPVCAAPASAILILLGQCWREAMELILRAAHNGGDLDSGALADGINGYRKIVTAILDAPYGSILLADIPAWCELLTDMLKAKRHVELYM